MRIKTFKQAQAKSVRDYHYVMSDPSRPIKSIHMLFKSLTLQGSEEYIFSGCTFHCCRCSLCRTCERRHLHYAVSGRAPRVRAPPGHETEKSAN